MPDYKTTRSKRRTIPDWPAVQRAEDAGRALIDLWREYAAHAAQPYALSVFRKEFRRLCHIINLERVTNLLARQAHAAATTSRHVCITEAREVRCVLAEVRWRWTLNVL
jgi:hypothetical protein